MNKDLLNKIEIFLIGGNSTIGNAILDGVLEKHKNKDIEIISFIRDSGRGIMKSFKQT